MAERWEEVPLKIVAPEVFSDEVTEIFLAEVSIVRDVESVDLLVVSEKLPGVSAEMLLGVLL